jgi:leucyl aminopeptidase
MVFIILHTSKGLPKAATAAILVQPEANLAAHPLITMLAPSDREHAATTGKQFNPKVSPHRLVVLPSGATLLLIGTEEKKQFTRRKAILAMRHIVAAARAEHISELAVNLHDFETSDSDSKDIPDLFATQTMLANFEFDLYKKIPKEGRVSVTAIHIYSRLSPATLSGALERGKVIGEEVNESRSLANTPGGDMTPKHLADAAIKAGKRAGFTTTVLDEKEMAKLDMGGVLGVSKGSAERPRFIVMEYLKGTKSQKPVVLIGKGVTFDTGGLNLKTGDGIYEMHMDMSGGAAAIHTLATLARLGVKKNIVALVPAVENATSGSSYRPGDLLKTMSGKTIEVLNTDAEGRIILADAITYARKMYDPSLIIDIATLTGAAVVALGQRASAVFATDKKLSDDIVASAETAGDYAWPLPLWEEYESEIKGTFADVANLGKTSYGGAITAAVFLWQFVKDDADEKAGRTHTPQPWIHIDIAPRMTSIEGEWLAKGSSGAPIALLAHFLRAHS